MKYFIILLIASFVFFGCDANDAGSGDGSSQDDNGGSNEDEDPQVADLCLGVESENTTHTLDDGKDYTIIRNQDGLQAIRDDLAVNYLLCADIDIDPTSTFAQLNPNTDIDNDSSTFDGTEFIGTFNGNNKTISNLKIEATQADYVGLFGKIGADGEVRDLTLSLAGDVNNPGISGGNHVGALAGENEGTITNVRVNGDITGNDALGGLVGRHVSGTITASHVTGNVAGGLNADNVGGLVGTNSGTIEYSSASSNVKGDPNSSIESIGGLVGYNTGIVTASYATGDVSGATGEYIGGLMGGNLRPGDVTNSYATGAVTGVTGSGDKGGLIGHNDGPITASYFDASTTGIPEAESSGGIQGVTAYYTHVGGDGLVYTEADGAGDLIAQGNFPDWDDTIWTWQEGQWPTFQFQY